MAMPTFTIPLFIGLSKEIGVFGGFTIGSRMLHSHQSGTFLVHSIAAFLNKAMPCTKESRLWEQALRTGCDK